MGAAPGLHIDILLSESRALLCQTRPLPTELHSQSALLLYISLRFTDIIILFIFHKLLKHLTLFLLGLFLYQSPNACFYH